MTDAHVVLQPNSAPQIVTRVARSPHLPAVAAITACDRPPSSLASASQSDPGTPSARKELQYSGMAPTTTAAQATCNFQKHHSANSAGSSAMAHERAGAPLGGLVWSVSQSEGGLLQSCSEASTHPHACTAGPRVYNRGVRMRRSAADHAKSHALVHLHLCICTTCIHSYPQIPV